MSPQIMCQIETNIVGWTHACYSYSPNKLAIFFSAYRKSAVNRKTTVIKNATISCPVTRKIVLFEILLCISKSLELMDSEISSDVCVTQNILDTRRV